jgi:N6-L-threonylcarbamoyladenine synthase
VSYFMPTILGIESTCDETAAAVVVDGRDVRSNVVATQVDLHAKYRGVVPEIASRAHIENILPVLREALDKAACGVADIDAVAVAHRPGLIGSLLIGVTAAKSLAWSLGKPLIGIDHVHAHLYSVLLNEDAGQGSKPEFPAVGLVCSGGHTALYRVGSWTDVELIGSTIDDAVGEAYDKAAAILGLGYPGGPILDKLAAMLGAESMAIKLPRTYLARHSLDFSFSGLKTAVLYHVRGVPNRRDPQAPPKPPPTANEIRDIAASFQAACIDVIMEKLIRAIGRVGAKSVIIGGGVSANRGLRAAMANFSIPVLFPQSEYCTDNAAMTAGLADVYFRLGEFAPLDLDAITYSQFRRSE